MPDINIASTVRGIIYLYVVYPGICDLAKDSVTIAIHRKTHERLKKFGKYGDTWDIILNRLADIADKKER